MARERRTDLTPQGQDPVGRQTTKKMGAINPGTGKATSIRPGTAKAGAIRPGTGKTTSLRPATGGFGAVGTGRNGAIGTGRNGAVGGGYRRSGKRSLANRLVSLILLGALGYVGWLVYDQKVRQPELARLAAEEAERARLEREAAEQRERELAEQREAEEKARLAREESARQERELAAQREAEEKARLEREAEEKRKRELAEQERKENEAKVAATLERLRGKLEEAKALAEEGKFAEAGEVMRAAVTDKDIPDADRKRHEMYARNFETFHKTMGEVKPEPESSAEKMFWFIMKNGQNIRGKVDTEGLEDITLIGNGGVKTMIPVNRVEKRVPIKQEEIDESMLAQLEELRKSSETGVEWFMLAVQALKNNQPKYAVRAFNRAAEADGEIAQNIREHRARLLFASGAFDRTLGNANSAQRKFDRLIQTYPDTKAAQLAGAAIKQEEEIIAQFSKKQGSTGGSAEANAISKEVADAAKDLQKGDISLSKANAMLSQAEALERKAQGAESRAVSNEMYKEAVSKLTQALAIYQSSLKGDAGDERIHEQMSLIARRLYWCRKMQTL